MVQEFPKELVEKLGPITIKTLEEGFFLTLVQGEATMIDSWLPSSEVAVKLDFEGGKINGWVSIDSTLSLLSSLWNDMMEEDGSLSIEDAQDFAGEIANQIVGQLKFCLMEINESLRFNLSTPNVLSDHKADCPTLLIPLADPSGELHIVYCFKLLDWPDTI